jgi:hypothetical protein
MAKTPIIRNDFADEQENYLHNKEVAITEFNALIIEYRSNPNKHFLHALFCMIKVQDTFIAHIIKNGHRFADLKTERTTFSRFMKRMREALGENEFDKMYVEWKKRCEEED